MTLFKGPFAPFSLVLGRMVGLSNNVPIRWLKQIIHRDLLFSHKKKSPGGQLLVA